MRRRWSVRATGIRPGRFNVERASGQGEEVPGWARRFFGDGYGLSRLWGSVSHARETAKPLDTPGGLW